jgi:hypothetical protein
LAEFVGIAAAISLRPIFPLGRTEEFYCKHLHNPVPAGGFVVVKMASLLVV